MQQQAAVSIPMEKAWSLPGTSVSESPLTQHRQQVPHLVFPAADTSQGFSP